MTFKSFAKLNIFLKIVGKRDYYHEINSRFVRFENLFDELIFKKKDILNKNFELVGNFDCKVENNTIYKAYTFLKDYTKSEKINNFFENYTLHVRKNIPSGSGLGGGSSNAATFLLALNDILKLNLKQNILFEMGQKIGADVNFFISKKKAANVTGIGEIVQEFFDDECDIELIFPPIHSNTARVFRTFRDNFYNEIDPILAQNMMKLKTSELLKNYTPYLLNDLLKSVLICYGELKEFAVDGNFLSGSGSTFFKVKNNG